MNNQAGRFHPHQPPCYPDLNLIGAIIFSAYTWASSLVTNIGRRRLLITNAAAATLAPPRLAGGIARATAFRRVVRVGVVTPLAAAPRQACQAFADTVAATPVLNSALQLEVHANGVLGGEIEMVKACAAGALDLVFAVSNVVAGLVPELGLLDVPFLFRDAAHARATLDGPIDQEYVDLLLGRSLNMLAWGENGVRHVTANKPVRALSDLRGLHIRVPQSAVMVKGFRTLGALPETLPFPRLYEALRTGRFEAQENPVATIAAAHLEQVQRCLSLTGHAYSAAFFLASSDLLDDLDDAQRSALRSCALIGAKLSREAASRGERDGVEQLHLRAAGMTIVDDVDRAALATASAPALQAAGLHFGPDRVVRATLLEVRLGITDYLLSGGTAERDALETTTARLERAATLAEESRPVSVPQGRIGLVAQVRAMLVSVAAAIKQRGAAAARLDDAAAVLSNSATTLAETAARIGDRSLAEPASSMLSAVSRALRAAAYFTVSGEVPQAATALSEAARTRTLLNGWLDVAGSPPHILRIAAATSAALDVFTAATDNLAIVLRSRGERLLGLAEASNRLADATEQATPGRNPAGSVEFAGDGHLGDGCCRAVRHVRHDRAAAEHHPIHPTPGHGDGKHRRGHAGPRPARRRQGRVGATAHSDRVDARPCAGDGRV